MSCRGGYPEPLRLSHRRNGRTTTMPGSSPDAAGNAANRGNCPTSSGPCNRFDAPRLARFGSFDRRFPDVQMGPALLPTPLAPVARTGVSLSEKPRKACPKAMSPGARAGIRFRQAARTMRTSFLPAWRFRDRNSRGGPTLHLTATRPRPCRFHPRRAGDSGRRWRACRCSWAGRASIRRPSRTCRLQCRAVFATASKPSDLLVPVRF